MSLNDAHAFAFSLAATLMVAAISFLRPAPVFAQIEEVRIGVDGMTCNLCAASLERALRKLVRRGARAKAKIGVSLTDRAGNATSERLVLKLRR